MAIIYCHINQCDASVQYFAILHVDKILHDFREIYKTENTLTLTFIGKNKRRCTIRQCLRQNTFVAPHMTIVARQSHYIVRRKIFAIR